MKAARGLPTSVGRQASFLLMASDDEIERCIDSQYERLVRVLWVVTGSLPDAEEAVQEAFARAWERRRKGLDFDHLAGWVATVALNYARSRHRRQRTEQRTLDSLAGQRESAASPNVELQSVVRAAVEGLASRQRDAVVLYYLLDLDVATVSNLLGVSDGTIKTALSRARRTLAAELAETRHELEA